MNPANLRNRVTFYHPPGEVVGGWPSQEWTEYVTVWGAIETQRGYRIFKADATQWQDKKVVTIRYRNDIHEGMRLKINGVMHELESPPINEDERNRWLTLIVREVL